jgi:hypothetical protein
MIHLTYGRAATHRGIRGLFVIREVEQPGESIDRDDRQRLREACRLLRWIDPELAEWTVCPATPEGQPLYARLLLTNVQAPLEQLAGVLRHVADELDRLARNQRLHPSETRR